MSVQNKPALAVPAAGGSERNVVQMHTSRAARAKGAALAVAITANRLGLSPAQVIACAQATADRVRDGKASAAKAIADAKAGLRMKVPAVTA